MAGSCRLLSIIFLSLIYWSSAFLPLKRSFVIPRGGGGKHDNNDDEDDRVDLDEGVNVIKKSNAVGDPDGEGSSSDDDDDDEDGISDWEDLLEQADPPDDDDDDDGLDTVLEQGVQVEVEYVQEQDEEEYDEERPSRGGVGMRLGQRFGRPRNKRKKESTANNNNNIEEHLISAWQPHVYYPSSDISYLEKNSRRMDAEGKSRLDRRTLYGGLVLEWTSTTSGSRRFLSTQTAQALQAALAMATQPSWRTHSPRTSAIRLYDADHVYHGCTLAMQETIAMAMAHSMGVGVVAIDDTVLETVRQQLLQNGYTEEDVKPSALIRSLLALGRQGALVKGTASIATCMRADMKAGLDDPFDERATTSCEAMAAWENEWKMNDERATSNKNAPLVIFLRTQQSKSLLKSKSAVDALLKEANSKESRNLLVIGKGVDAATMTLPQDPPPDVSSSNGNNNNQPNQGGIPGPWFGFANHNQNASGQNDPEGSRRFNIFLARTVDPKDGKPGIVGAVAPPEAGNLFPHMLAMQAQARLQLQQNEDDPQAKAELERWSQMLQQQMENNGAPSSSSSMLSPQYFNATLSSDGGQQQPQNVPPPSPEVIQQTLEHSMSELLDKLADMNDDGSPSSDLSPDLQKAFSQVLRNEGLRRGIAENLSRAALALSDPKCQGVLLSVFVPPPGYQMGKTANNNNNNNSNKPPSMGGWFQKMLNNQEEASAARSQSEDSKKSSKQKRVRTMAAAAAMMAAQDAREAGKQENKVDRNLQKLESLSQPIVIGAPADPVRAKSWNAWIQRERGSVVFRQNRRLLNKELEKRSLSLQEHTGTQGAGSALRQMLSVRLMEDEMPEVITRAIELEAAKAQRVQKSPSTNPDEIDLDVDITLSQLCLTDSGIVASEEVVGSSSQGSIQFLHPSSLEGALSSICKISSTPTGGLSVHKTPAAFRSREEIGALAQDKHERALVAQVVSPQDIGVTYDMIGGLSEVKELLRQSITYPLKFPHLYSEGIAREAVKGVLLFGPPGTGKTMLAKAVATEGGASFLSVEASSVENKWLGESEKNAKAVFTLARRLAPCVIFIDEVDSLLSSREGSSDDSAHGTLTSVKTTMMSEWDGLNSGTNGQGEAGSDRVVVIGSTNRPFDLDEAVLRRFPRRILVDLPDLETRKEILEVTLSENRLDPVVNLTSIAERLEGYTGSDLKEVCREAVVQISHEQAKLLDQGLVDTKDGSLQRLRPVTSEDFEKALSKLKRSVAENGKELARVWEWNDQYGEIKKENKNQVPHLSNMYL